MNLTIIAKSTTKRYSALSATNWFPVQVKIVSQSYYMDANKLDDSQVPKHFCRSSHHVVQQIVGIVQLLLWVIFLDNRGGSPLLYQRAGSPSACLPSRMRIQQNPCPLFCIEVGEHHLNARDCLQAKRCKMWRL